MRLFLAVLLLAALPLPAYAHGIYLPEGLVFGTLGTLVVSSLAAWWLPTKFPQGLIVFFAGVFGGALCGWMIAALTANLLDGSSSGAAELAQVFGPATSCFAALVSAIFVNFQSRGLRMRDDPRVWLITRTCFALMALSALAPVFADMYLTGYGRRYSIIPVMIFFPLAAAVGATAFFLGRKIGRDAMFMKIVVYAPMGAYALMLACDRFGWGLPRAVLWFGILFGYPAAVTLFAQKRLKQKKREADAALDRQAGL